jgi:hypothetical protein
VTKGVRGAPAATTRLKEVSAGSFLYSSHPTNLPCAKFLSFFHLVIPPRMLPDWFAQFGPSTFRGSGLLLTGFPASSLLRKLSPDKSTSDRANPQPPNGHVLSSECQPLAVMDHLNIAKVLDAGATEARRPFFVM